MRYISKIDLKDISDNVNLLPLNNYILAELNGDPDPLNPSYGGLNQEIKTTLITQLLEEQKGLCCYCMQRIEEGIYHIEHLSPKCGFRNEEVQYYNLFLSCGSNRERKNHCGIVKNNIPIPKLISFYNNQTTEKCQDFFKYNLQGEILPKQGFEDILTDFNNYTILNALSKQLLGVIEVLKLNSEILKTNRRVLADTIMHLPDNLLALQNILIGYQTPNEHGFLDSLCEVAVFFLTLKIQRLQN